MKSQDEVIRALAQNGQEKLLLQQFFDQYERSQQRNYLTHTRFLDLRERTLCVQAAQQTGAQNHTVFWGGYEQAERVVVLCYPDYMTAQQAIEPEQSPFVLLRACKSPTDTLSHRDYLGALMGLGIERAVLGDIVLHEDGADLLVLEQMAEFICMNFLRAGRKRITLERLPLTELRLPQIQETVGEGSVASLRLDCVAALMFRQSRGQMQQAIEKGLMFVNQMQCMKPDAEVMPGDRITVRGLGRARLIDCGGVSRKGRQFVQYARTV